MARLWYTYIKEAVFSSTNNKQQANFNVPLGAPGRTLLPKTRVRHACLPMCTAATTDQDMITHSLVIPKQQACKQDVCPLHACVSQALKATKDRTSCRHNICIVPKAHTDIHITKTQAHLLSSSSINCHLSCLQSRFGCLKACSALQEVQLRERKVGSRPVDENPSNRMSTIHPTMPRLQNTHTQQCKHLPTSIASADVHTCNKTITNAA